MYRSIAPETPLPLFGQCPNFSQFYFLMAPLTAVERESESMHINLEVPAWKNLTTSTSKRPNLTTDRAINSFRLVISIEIEIRGMINRVNRIIKHQEPSTSKSSKIIFSTENSRYPEIIELGNELTELVCVAKPHRRRHFL